MGGEKRSRLLVNVVRIGRQELADREQADIPHKLRAVARSTGRGLPAPLEQTLLAFIEVNEDFRRSVAERFENASIDDAIAAAFLADPVDAQTLIDARLSGDEIERLKADLAAAAATIDDLESKLGVARVRVDELRTKHERDMNDQAAATKRAREGLEQRLSDSLRDVGNLREERAELTEHVESLTATVSEMRERLARRDERAQRRLAAFKGHRTDAVTQSLPSDPVELAAMLDDIEQRLHFYRESDFATVEQPANVQPFRLPSGISPESSEAVDSALAQGPDSILVDGYNIAGAVADSSIGSREGRDHAIARAEALKRGSPSSEVIVVFDASESGGRGGFRTREGVLVEFEPTMTADDAIVEFVHSGTDRCLVVTNDRELQDRSTREGCIVVFSTALILWTEHLNGRVR